MDFEIEVLDRKNIKLDKNNLILIQNSKQIINILD